MQFISKVTIILLFLIMFISCGDSDKGVTYSHTISNFSVVNDNKSSTSEVSVKNVSFNFNGNDYQVREEFLSNSPADGIQRINVGVGQSQYGVVDVENINGVLTAKHYSLKGKLLMTAEVRNGFIYIKHAKGKLNEIIAPKSGKSGWIKDTLKAASDWADRFDGCVEDFIDTVNRDPEWGAVIVVGMVAGYSAHILAGLAVGCAISASS